MTKPDSRTALINAAKRLMLGKGYPATTVDEICMEAGVSKGSFYNHFQSKEDLGLAIMESHMKGASELTEGGEFNEFEDPLEKALGYIDFMESLAPEIWGHGCILGTFAIDLSETNPAIRTEVAKYFDGLANYLADLFSVFLPEDPDPGVPTAYQLAEMFLSGVEGSIVLAKAHDDPQRIVDAIRRFREYVILLSGRAGKPVLA